MQIHELKERPEIQSNRRLNNLYVQFRNLLDELRKKQLNDTVIQSVNSKIDELNSTSVPDDELRKIVRKKQSCILKSVEKAHKIVPKNYYRNIWLAVGMAAFGLPLGTALGVAVGNMGLLGAGLPIGMVLGMAVGTGMDKKAMKEGRQLNIEIKY